jgi:hypothetical protein
MSGRETSPAGRPSTFSPRKKEFKLGDRPYKEYLSQDCDLKPSTFSPRRREFKLGDKPYQGYLSQDCDFRKNFSFVLF